MNKRVLLSMYYIKNNSNGRKYYLSPISEVLLKISIPISYLFYGICIALLFDLLGIQSDTVILVLVAAYVIELLLNVLDLVSPTQMIFAGFAFIILLPIWIDIARTGNINLFKITYRRMRYFINIFHGIGCSKWRDLSEPIVHN